MNLRNFRIIVLLTSLLGTTAFVVLFAAAPYVGSAHSMLVSDDADNLPALTVSFSLPLLRQHAANPFSETGSAPWVWAVWTLLLGCLPGPGEHVNLKR